ncbi:Helix-turn-helix domain-containing protein [Flexibacter flexilis DSM 6793]|uniref:Helix-turn-helix domain-containing protein n=1 Tax=Flexibacter flexilis DSM 6793 TaxID=927664 RepID=A0A1I1HVB1_9BACT|nr:helix-turn-helix domain-containing protein [Flexibacter flexilis]SFC28007.1 Helix-turn-helix domain-containing protein [Flexibacter flexilis DSM 6793]
MQLNFYTPQHIDLRHYIEGYYFITRNQPQKSLRYFTFPNNYCILSVNRNADIQRQHHRYLVRFEADGQLHTSIVTRYIQPLEIVYQEPVDEITIYFKPLAINHFMADSVRLLGRENIDNFNPFADFGQTMQLIFDTQDRPTQINLLEQYWLSKWQPRPDLEQVQQLIANMDGDTKIEEIAQKYQCSRQHLNRLFRKYLGKSPAEFRKILRFRAAIANYGHAHNLTDLSHGFYFYDQSHFIRDFKALTGILPKDFFRNVNTDKGNIWLLA